MPEVSRFFGIIIRMYVEAGGPYHMPHFHAYYQDHGEFTILRQLSVGLVRFRGVRSASCWLGQNFTNESCCRTGRRCNRGIRRLRLNH